MGCTRQVIQHVALQCSDECRAKFMAEIFMYDPSMFVWIDESGFDCVRKRAYSIRGMIPRDQTKTIDQRHSLFCYTCHVC